MITYLVNGTLVDPNGNPVDEPKAEASGPFSSLSPAVQKALETAGITTVEQAKAKGKAALVELKGIGETSAEQILALEAAE